MERAADSRPYAGAGSPAFAGQSAVSWPAIMAGAVVATSVSVVMFTLGSGLGFASLYPWAGRVASAESFAVSAAIWLIVTQWISSGVGGYITGRLRIRWHGTHTHEVFFRDTAHGLITWAVATVLLAAALATSLSSTMTAGEHVTSVAASAATRTGHAAVYVALSMLVGAFIASVSAALGGRLRDEHP